MPDVVEVVQIVGAVVEIEAPKVVVVDVPAVVGPPGPAGSGQALVWQPPSALATWSIPHTFGRRPAVALYVGDEIVHADVAATASSVVITWPLPTSGEAVLT